MFSLPGYSIRERIAETPGVALYRACRDSTNSKVVLKALRVPDARRADVARFRHQYERIAGVSSPHLVGVHGTKELTGALVVVLDDFCGLDLASVLKARGKLPVAEALTLALSLAEALVAVHKAGLVHGDVRPQNVFVGDDLPVKLTGFGVDAEITRAHEALYSPTVIADVLPYISPEQTGRMNRGVDYRTDLYSLGIVLYEVLTGKRPFEASDPMELFHAHLAAPPEPPHHLDPSIPEPVSRIILKLLNKDAEERYQSAEGLIADLARCQKEFARSGRIEPFAPGQCDRNELFRIHQKLYGRERDIEELVTAFERVLQGQREIVLVSGYSGIGKSCLVQEILRPLAREKGYYTSGKYEQYNRDAPYSAVIQAFDGLVRQILAESEERIMAWGRSILKVLGENTRVISDVIPSLLHVVGEQPPVADLSPVDAQNRLNQCFFRFVSVFAKSAHPLVLFLDDLQWVDAASLELLRGLLADDSLDSFFFCGAYRDNEVSPSHTFILAIEELKRSGLRLHDIVLEPLARPHLYEMLSDSLKRRDCGPLADAVLKKTGGNPFFAKRFVRSLYDNGALSYTPGSGWHWDLEKLDALAYTDNVIDLMVRTIARLPASTVESLKLAAAIGNKFDLNVLSAVNESTPEELYSSLEHAVDEGLLSASRTNYRFAHDKVQEGAYSMIPKDGRAAFHLRIGRLLADKLDIADSQSLFDVVSHLNSAVELIDDPSERIRLARMNLDAASRAEDSAAFGAALRYLELGLSCLPEDAWTSQYTLRLAYAMKMGLMLALSGRHDDGLTTLAAGIERTKGRLDRTQMLRLKMNVQVLKNDLPAALTEGLEALRPFGIDLPPFPDDATLEAHFQTTLALVEEKSLNALVDLPLLADPEINTLQDVLVEIFPACYFLSTNNLHITIAKILDNTVQYGFSKHSIFGCTIFGMLLCARGDIARGYEFGYTAAALAKRHRDKSAQAYLGIMMGGHIQHWKEPYARCKETLVMAVQTGIETGQYIWAFYSMVNVAMNSFLRGLPIADLLDEINSYQPVRKLDRFNAISWMAGAVGQIAHNLSVQVPRPAVLVGQWVDICEVIDAARSIGNEASLFLADIFVMINYVLHGAFEDAARLSFRKPPSGNEGNASWQGDPAFHFYGCVGLTQTASEASPEERERLLERAESFAKQLSYWAQFCPDNLAHRSTLLRAELARARGDARAACDDYDEAIALARAGRFLHDEALGNELCGKHWLALGKTTIARAYLTEAHRLYGRWGATEAMRRLERTYPEDLISHEILATEAPSAAAKGAEALDIGSVLKAAQAISGEIVLPRLLDALMRILVESAGATRAVLVLERDGQLAVEAELRVGEAVEVLKRAPLETRVDMPITVVTYVARTRQDVLLDDRALAGPFGNDPYLSPAAPKSALAAPITSKGRLAGVIYLENVLARDSFTSARVELISMLSAQISISVENARLYAELERKVDERTAELVRANEEILALNRAAQEAVARQIDHQRTLIERQQEAIQVLSVPIIEIWDSVIAVPLMGAIDDRRSQDVMHRLLARISSDACRFVILDLTGVEVVDTNIADRLLHVVRATRLLGASVVVSGIRPAVAHAMTHLGTDLAGLKTCATLADALRHCLQDKRGAGSPALGRGA